MGGRNGLNHQQKLFAVFYAECRNATEAAKQAGYSARTAASQGSELLNKPTIQAIINKRIERVTEKTEITIERVVNELHRILIADPIEALEDSGAVKPLCEWPSDLRRAVSGFDVETKHIVGEEGTLEVTTKKVKFWSKTAAADQLLKKLNAYSEPTADALNSISRALLEIAEKRGSK